MAPQFLDYCSAQRDWLLDFIEALVAIESPSDDPAAVNRCGVELASRLEALGGALSRAILAGRVDGATGTTVLMPAKKLPCQRILVVGLGPQAEFKGKNLAVALDSVLEKIDGLQDTDLAVALPGTKPWPPPRNAAEVLGEKLLHGLAAAGRSATISILGPPDLLAEIREWVRTQGDPVASHVSLEEDSSAARSEARDGA